MIQAQVTNLIVVNASVTYVACWQKHPVAEAVSRVFGLQVSVQCTLAGTVSAAAENVGGDADQKSKLQDVLSMFPGSELEE